MGPFGQLLTMVAAALVPFHVSFRLPEADRKALVGTGVYEKKQTHGEYRNWERISCLYSSIYLQPTAIARLGVLSRMYLS